MREAVPQFELLIEKFEEALGVRLFNGTAVGAREEPADEALGVFARMFADHFHSTFCVRGPKRPRPPPPSPGEGGGATIARLTPPV